MPRWNTYYKPAIYEIIVTTIRNRSSFYIDHGICINAELFAREVEQALIRKLSATRSKDVFSSRNIIDTLVLIMRQKEAQLGIYDATTRSNNSTSTKEAS